MDEEVESKFECPICCEVLKRPIVIRTCGHRFCTECLQQVVQSNSECPVCRMPFNVETESSPDAELEAEISRTTTVCSGCQQEFTLMHFNSHSVSCSKRQKHPPTFASLPNASQSIPPPGPNRSTFACPLCDQKNIDLKTLLKHVNQYHANVKRSVVCPVCVSMPWGNPQQVSSDFVGHLNLRHQFEYDTYVDYEQDDDTALQAVLEASVFER